MKKFKKVLVCVCSVATIFSASVFSNAEAMSFLEDRLEMPEGYSEIADMEGTFAKKTISPYERESEGITFYSDVIRFDEIIIYEMYKYNYTEFKISADKTDTFDEIYAKYSEKLDMDCFYKGTQVVNHLEEGVNAVFYDIYDESGSITNDSSKMENKRELIQEMCAELYKEKCISSAIYRSVVCSSVHGTFYGLRVVLNNGFNESDYEKMQSILDNYDDAFVQWYAEGTSEYSICCGISDYKQITADLKEVYTDNIEVNDCISLLADSETAGSAEIDILSELKSEPAILYGDIGFDGKVGILDVVAMNKAINGSVILNAEQQKAADLNGDGNIDGDDMDLLLRFLVDLIDSVPAAQ
ncbi:MAG: dockerin type I repeat-containing protein [Ruminococcus sp.]